MPFDAPAGMQVLLHPGDEMVLNGGMAWRAGHAGTEDGGKEGGGERVEIGVGVFGGVFERGEEGESVVGEGGVG